MPAKDGLTLLNPKGLSRPHLTTRINTDTMNKKLRTAKEARAWLSYLGITVAQWSREHGFNEQLVREVLAGRKLGLRGHSHNIAIALGMKNGLPTDRPARVPPAQRRTHAATTAKGAAA